MSSSRNGYLSETEKYLGFFGFHYQQVLLYHLCHFLLVTLKNMRMFIISIHYINKYFIKDYLKLPS